MARTIAGHFVVFNVPSLPIGGEFIEIIRPGAFDRTLRRDDPRALWQHNHEIVLGRQSARTLRLHTDRVGLYAEIDVPSWADGHYESVSRGDVTQASFGFATELDAFRYEGDQIVREVFALTLYEVSPTTWPAYPQTTIGAGTAARGSQVEYLQRVLQMKRADTALRLAK